MSTDETKKNFTLRLSVADRRMIQDLERAWKLENPSQVVRSALFRAWQHERTVRRKGKNNG